MAKVEVETVKEITPSERVRRLRERIAQSMPSMCIERACLITESYKETEGEPFVIRRAKALEKVLKEMTISIEDDELIVGRPTGKLHGCTTDPDHDWKKYSAYLEGIDAILARDPYDRRSPFTEEEMVKMKEILPYWKGKSLCDRWHAVIPENIANLVLKIASLNTSALNNASITHNAVDFDKVLTIGLNGVKKQVDEELAKLNLADIQHFEKFQYLKAVNIVLGATTSFAKRYAELVKSMAEKEANIQRKAELERIAEICDWIPANPARSFYEALQSVWLTFVCLKVESFGGVLCFGRADQYLYPFYKKDIEEGRITKEAALELIELVYIKLNGLSGIPLPTETLQFTSGTGAMGQGGRGGAAQCNVIVGGVTKDGKDAVNELSYLFIDADKEVALVAPDVVIRVSKTTTDALLMRACEALKSLKGKYKFVSDMTAIEQLLCDGKAIEHAREYIIAGCWANTIPGVSDDLPGSMMNLPLMLELALNNGVSRLTGEQLGPNTGDPREFKSYDEVWNAYKKQVETLMPAQILVRNVDRQLFADFAQCPLQSALFQGCIEKGRDILNGGTLYITQGLNAPSAPTVGDSLAAIKKAVFEDKKVTMARLIDALNKNFEGEEEILHVLKSAPKFGNDDDYVDSIVNEVLTHFCNEVAKYRGIAGAKASVAAATHATNIGLGAVVGALPDGRKAGEPISEGGISPAQGRNMSGPIATMRSVAKLDHMKLTNGSVLNMRFNPDALKDESKIRKFVSLLRTYCETGGYFVQFNIISTDILREAQRHPKEYRDLMVRVATYSAYFVDLSPELQNDIIARTEFEEV